MDEEHTKKWAEKMSGEMGTAMAGIEFGTVAATVTIQNGAVELYRLTVEQTIKSAENRD